MANPEHLAILKEGVEAWNAWREERHVEPDLRSTDLRGLSLEGLNLRTVDLSNANLQRARLSRSAFSGSLLTEGDLREAHLGGATFGLSSWFVRSEGYFQTRTAVLAGANLTGAYLNHTTFVDTDLCQADLRGADLTYSVLQDVELRGANLSAARFGSSRLIELDLSDAIGLDSTRHEHPSKIDFETLERTAEGLKEDRRRWAAVQMFFLHAGVPTRYIEAVGASLGPADEYCSVFISYAREDDGFAQRLHARMEESGIVCWLDKHAMKPGDRILDAVAEGIRASDKLLICCSEASLQSWWVKDEIMKALEREQRERRDILIPLDLDGSFVDWQDGLAAQLRSRVAANFQGWAEDNAKFEAEFERVVEALRAEGG